jgi:DnaJ like chaperone protein
MSPQELTISIIAAAFGFGIVYFSIGLYDAQKKADRESIKDDPFGIGVEDIIALMAIISKADGIVSQSELNVVDKIFRESFELDSVGRRKAIGVFNKYKGNFESYREVIDRVQRNNIQGAPETFVSIVYILSLIALADEVVHFKEKEIIEYAVYKFNVTHDLYENFIRTDANGEDVEQKVDDKMSMYMNIFGLSEGFDEKELKDSYRKIRSKYHPDKVNHLGKEFQDLAHDKIKEINTAYEYLHNYIS